MHSTRRGRHFGARPTMPRPFSRWATLTVATLLVLVTACGWREPTNAVQALAISQLQAAARGCNLVLVLLDAAAAGHCSVLGYGRQTTPHLAELAAEGVVFETAYAQAAATPLSIYSIHTSRYPAFEELPVVEHEFVFTVPPQTPTLARLLAPRFRARLCVSASGWSYPMLGLDGGFTAFHQVGPRDEIAGAEADGAVVTAAALQWIAEHQGEPFLAYLHYLEPHTPYAPPEPFASMFDPADRGHVDGSYESLKPFQHKRPPDPVVRNVMGLYDGNLAYADAQIGRLVAGLRQLGVWERTVFVVMADHGEAFWEHGARGHSLHAYEEFVRVPLLIRIPGGGAASAKRVGRPVELVDLLPTLLELFELPSAASAGESLLPAVLGAVEGPATAYTRNHSTHRVEFAMRLGDSKVIVTGRQRKPALFDLARDPGELVDLQSARSAAGSDSTRALGRRLQAMLQEWLAANRDAARGSIVDATDSLDAESIERLRSLGYFH